MLCFESVMARWRERGERRASRATAQKQRARSRSLCSSSADPTLLQLLHRRASSAISSASELITRRGVFSRRQYGSVEQVIKLSSDGGPDVLIRQYRLENGNSLGEKDELFGPHHAPVVENPEYETRWYFKYFLGKVHQNYVGVDSAREPFLLSIFQETTAGLLRAILFNRLGAHKIYIPSSAFATDQPAKAQMRPSVKQIISLFPTTDRVDKLPKEVPSAAVQKDVLLLEEQEGTVNFKMGVVFMKPGQTTDDEMLSNEFGDEKFERFLLLLGDTIRLKTWSRFRGGLDVKGDMTGLYSVYTMHRGHEIMFHVSTMLPYSNDNRQQLERKRHIGNDIVNIIFTDPEAHDNFNPHWIKSHFTHIFAIVSEVPTGYMLSVYSDELVPPFGPSLPCPPVFTDNQLFRDFLLVKMMNGEKAAFQTPTFALKRQRTLEMLIREIYTEHNTDKPMLSRRALSDVWSNASGPAGAARSERFLHFGQAIKLDALLRGDAPTSLVSSVEAQQRRQPWEGYVWRTTPLPGAPVCAEQVADSKILLSTTTNTYILEECGTTRVILRWDGCVLDARVTKRAGLFRVGASASAAGSLASLAGSIGVYAVPAAELYAGAWAMRPLQDCKQARLSRTKTAHYFDLVQQGDRVMLAVAVGRRVLLMTEEAKPGSARGFDYVHVKDIVLSEPPSMIRYLECSGMVVIVSGYKHHWEVINCSNNQIVRGPDNNGEERRGTLVDALRIGDERDRQLLLCYNHTCHFGRLTTRGLESDEDFDFHWTTVPYAVLNVFPYIMAFAEEMMEIRLLANGSLIHVASIPGLKLLCGRRDIFYLGCTEPAPEEDVCAGLPPESHEQVRLRQGPYPIEDEDRISAISGRVSSGSRASGSGANGSRALSSGASGSKASGSGTSFSGASFSGASFSGASFSGANFSGASFSGASGSGANGSGASGSGASGSGASGSGASGSGASGSGASWSGASGSGASGSGASGSGASGSGASGASLSGEASGPSRRERSASRGSSGSSRPEGSASSCSSSVSEELMRPPLQRMAPVSPPSSPQPKGKGKGGGGGSTNGANAFRNARVFKIPRANLCGGREPDAPAPPGAPDRPVHRPSSIRERMDEMNLEVKRPGCSKEAAV